MRRPEILAWLERGVNGGMDSTISATSSREILDYVEKLEAQIKQCQSEAKKNSMVEE